MSVLLCPWHCKITPQSVNNSEAEYWFVLELQPGLQMKVPVALVSEQGCSPFLSFYLEVNLAEERKTVSSQGKGETGGDMWTTYCCVVASLGHMESSSPGQNPPSPSLDSVTWGTKFQHEFYSRYKQSKHSSLKLWALPTVTWLILVIFYHYAWYYHEESWNKLVMSQTFSKLETHSCTIYIFMILHFFHNNV